MSFDAEKLYALMPSVYRLRDMELAEQMDSLLTAAEHAELQSLRATSPRTAEQEKRFDELVEKQRRGPLKALLSVMAEQAAVLSDNLEQLYDDFFIETCAEWVVPYIGELVGTRNIAAFPGASFTARAFVANTMAYRRRKGTAAVIEQLARDVTEWDANVVEFFQRLATTQYMNHIRPENVSFTDVGNAKALEFINTPFDKLARTADVRRIEPRRGKYNIPNVGIFLWRLGSYSVTDAPAFRIDEARFLFDALGKDIQLYNDPQTEEEITHLAEPINVPMPLDRRITDRYLDTYYGPGKSMLLNVNGVDLPAHDTSPPSGQLSVCICDLSDMDDGGGNIIWAHRPAGKVAIDPVLGRIAFPIESPPAAEPVVRVSYHYGFSAPMGGGEYDREESFISETVDVEVANIEPSLQPAIDQLGVDGGTIEVDSNEIFFDTPEIHLDAPGKRVLELRAKDGRRPVVVTSGDIVISGAEEAEVTLNGLIIAGAIRIPALDSNGDDNKLKTLRLIHCTLVPGEVPVIVGTGSPPPAEAAKPVGPVLIVETANTSVEIEQCIVGQIRSDSGAEIRISNSIVDASDSKLIAYAGLADDDPGASLIVENTTIIGKLYTRVMELASNTIFLSDLDAADTWPAPVRAERLQQGCVRFSYVPRGSQLPRLFHCQPATIGDDARVRPAFTSLRYGDAGYCQLSKACAIEITTGADDQSEMGVFHNLHQPRREANLRAALDEYLRFGLEAGIFYAS